jgi:hypothetical protein
MSPAPLAWYPRGSDGSICDLDALCEDVECALDPATCPYVDMEDCPTIRAHCEEIAALNRLHGGV